MGEAHPFPESFPPHRHELQGLMTSIQRPGFAFGGGFLVVAVKESQCRELLCCCFESFFLHGGWGLGRFGWLGFWLVFRLDWVCIYVVERKDNDDRLFFLFMSIVFSC